MNLEIPSSEQLTYNQYQELSKQTAVFPEINSELADRCLDFLMSAGQLAGIIKKIYRDGDGEMTRETRAKLIGKVSQIFDKLEKLEDIILEGWSKAPGEHPLPATVYPLLGLFDEVAEVVEKCGAGDVEGAEKELGDVNWYHPQIATALKLNSGTIAHQNLTKLFDRMKRGVIKGSGDNR